jgi:squamous cell carcinoma antigen recognized by T-cells 3
VKGEKDCHHDEDQRQSDGRALVLASGVTPVMSSATPQPPPRPVGEASWLDYIDQQVRTANTPERRLAVVELYSAAANAEPGSIDIWLAYCDYFWALHQQYGNPPAADAARIPRGFFSLDAALSLWAKAHDATKFRLSDSHRLWDRWISLERELLDRTRTPDGVRRITHLYRDRLLLPHLAWDATASAFSSFLSEYSPQAYESTMQEVTSRAAAAKALTAQRDHFETRLTRASDDPAALAAVYSEYLHWEINNTKKERGDQVSAIQLALALFSRALTGPMATDEGTWADFVVCISTLRTTYGDAAHRNDELLRLLPNVLDILQRAVQHCPWSGHLWARYILSGEAAGLAFRDMERIKHTATNSSQLDRDGMTAVVDMYAAWCGYLKRTAMHSNATDEAVDIADSGLVAALEAVRVWGERRFGSAYQGDPKYRLERILIQYLTEKHAAIDEARDQWKGLASKELYAASYDFWLTYFMWEMLVFQAQRNKGRSPTPGAPAAAVKGLTVPTIATKVLERAIREHSLDWPERVMEVYLNHCNDYETPETLRQALDSVHRVKRGVAKRREREAAEAQAAYAAQLEAQQPTPADSGEAVTVAAEGSPAGPKRKRDPSPGESGGSEKKRQKNLDSGEVATAGDSGKKAAVEEQAALKRDRENTSIFAANLPADVSTNKIKGYFREYGHINNITVHKEKDGKSTVALIEFQSPEDVPSALLRDGKYFGEQQISVKPAANVTLFVTNYPPLADEAYLRRLFKDCGEVFSVRFPSLKFNTRRRFCYITFREPEAAAIAVGMDGTELDGNFNISVKYSDPSNKKARDGATAEGREIHITGLDLTVDEDELEELCAKFGAVSRVRVLRTMAGKSRGSAFVTLEKKEDAEKAVSELDKTKLRSQILQVEVAVPTNYKVAARSAMSPAPSSTKGEDEDMPDAPPNERTFALLDIPDTVNDTRVRSLVEKFGQVTKLILRADHGGAIVEMADVASAGKAQLGLEGAELDGRALRTGTVSELFRAKGEKRVDRVDRPASKPAASLLAMPRVQRPVAKGGPKRGLGFKTEKAAAKVNGTSAASDGSNSGPKKTNADFRSLFLDSAKQDNGKEAEGEQRVANGAGGA